MTDLCFNSLFLTTLYLLFDFHCVCTGWQYILSSFEKHKKQLGKTFYVQILALFFQFLWWWHAHFSERFFSECLQRPALCLQTPFVSYHCAYRKLFILKKTIIMLPIIKRSSIMWKLTEKNDGRGMQGSHSVPTIWSIKLKGFNRIQSKLEEFCSEEQRDNCSLYFNLV